MCGSAALLVENRVALYDGLQVHASPCVVAPFRLQTHVAAVVVGAHAGDLTVEISLWSVQAALQIAMIDLLERNQLEVLVKTGMDAEIEASTESAHWSRQRCMSSRSLGLGWELFLLVARGRV